jgi:hypothetical protein
MKITATYSPEDNKLRLYASERLDPETYEKVKAAGFFWAPKQQLFVAPKWTPAREDLALLLAGDIEPEEMTLAERAIIKAERLDALAVKRNAQAVQLSSRVDELGERFSGGQPILIGHHSERSARRDHERREAAQKKAVKASEAANYWLYRADGVECFANMKNCERTRRNRIKTLLAELRDLQRGINEAHAALLIWDKLTTDEQIRYAVGNLSSHAIFLSSGAYTALQNGEKTPADIRESAIAAAKLRIEGPTRRRWIDHVLNRLGFERQMLGDVPRFDGELTPVILQAFAREMGADKPKAIETDPGFYQLESPLPLPLNIAERNYLELSADEWRDLMQDCGHIVEAAKPRRVSSKPAPASLVNPTQAEAAQLQEIWNLQMQVSCMSKSHITAKTAEVAPMTQDVYSRNAKGTYGRAVTMELDENGKRISNGWYGGEYKASGVPVVRIRAYTASADFYTPYRVIQVTDKPAKALPLDLGAIRAALLEQLAEPVAVAA